MTESRNSAVLAVDGGGTRCRVACDMEGAVHSVETGPANVSSDFEGAIKQINIGFERLAKSVGCRTDDMLHWPSFVGLAGVTDAGIASRLRVSLGLAQARIKDDRPAALRGALGAQDGLIAHCGTGSFLAAQMDGEMRFAGGWGPVLGDEASAQWVGRRALTESLNVMDGVEEETGLTRKLLDRFDGTAGIVGFAGTATPDQFGALAPEVTASARENDAIAKRIMQAGGDYIASMAAKLGWRPDQAFCLTGGIASHYADYLPPEMQSAVLAPLAEPLVGALELAKEIQHEHN
ncbi:BadF/BadG/BcrA/BcrD ATPase family protein [Ruegeria sp. HKCCA5491]|uniref:BadF/BadG/BcrA/BcrD ATPase family protein n=1 Tax=Ruegeria sp. HKCCA5491 TaxID=2682986 RepID=UPI001488BDEE|nr:BadF/BadG/BcrA/BcrD ATPase family protein [Ruegeria sp. HKCCA5491]